jgi:16S rRNA (uracil1498-N3)-methyltransferase
LRISARNNRSGLLLPKIEGPIDFNTVVNEAEAGSKYIAYVDSNNPEHLKTVAQRESDAMVLIGPEGDFSPSGNRGCRQ